MTDYQLIFCSYPDFTRAEHAAQTLVKQRLAACVHIFPTMTAVYMWQDKLETAQEHLLIIKATTLHYSAIENCLKTHHPYDIPEIIAMPITQGLPAYLSWINTTCHDTLLSA